MIVTFGERPPDKAQKQLTRLIAPEHLGTLGYEAGQAGHATTPEQRPSLQGSAYRPNIDNGDTSHMGYGATDGHEDAGYGQDYPWPENNGARSVQHGRDNRQDMAAPAMTSPPSASWHVYSPELEVSSGSSNGEGNDNDHSRRNDRRQHNGRSRHSKRGSSRTHRSH